MSGTDTQSLLKPSDAPSFIIDLIDGKFRALTTKYGWNSVPAIKVIYSMHTATGLLTSAIVNVYEEWDENEHKMTYGAYTDVGVKVAVGWSIGETLVTAAVALTAPATVPVATSVVAVVGAVALATVVANEVNNNIDLDQFVDRTIANSGIIYRDLYKSTVQTTNHVTNVIKDYSYDAAIKTYSVYKNAVSGATYYGQELGKLIASSVQNSRVKINLSDPNFASSNDAYINSIIQDVQNGYESVSGMLTALYDINLRNQTTGESTRYIFSKTDPQAILQSNKDFKLTSYSNGSETTVVTNSSGQILGYVTKDVGAMVTTSGGGNVPKFSLLSSILDESRAIQTFFADYTKTVTDYYSTSQGTDQFQSALAQIAVRLANGEDFNVVITQISAQLMLAPNVSNLFGQLVAGSNLVPQNYQAYASMALANATIQGLMTGNFTQALQNASVQAAIQGGIVNNLDFLTVNTLAGPQLNAAGLGVTAAVASLAGAMLNGGIDSKAITNAATAGVIAYTSSAITTALVGTAPFVSTTAAGASAGSAGVFGLYGAYAGPIGVAVGFAVAYLSTQLMQTTQYIHGESVSHITQIQPDGSLLLVATRPAGSLLKTTGTTNDDYIGNDSADDTGGADVIVGQSGMNEIYGRGGHDFIEGRAAADYIDAGTGDDHVEAGSGDDYVDGGAGNDRIFGQTGNDSILAGDGNDIVLGGDGNDNIEGQAGADRLYGGDGNDNIIGGLGNDTLDGGSGDDILAGEAGDDQVDGGAGNDTIQLGDGNDTGFGGDGNDNMEGNAGNDILLGEGGVDVLYGGDGNDTLDGGLENDLAFGGIGKDTLIGGYGDDDLYGEIGEDLLAGGGGNDLLAGGDDNDLYLYARNGGADTIQDSAGLNTLKLVDLNASDVASMKRIGDDLVITFDALNSVTVKDHFLASGLNRIEFANGQGIVVGNMTFDAVTGVGTYAVVAGTNILASYAEQNTNYQLATASFSSTTALSTGWLTSNYDLSVTTDAVEKEIYNDVQVKNWQKSGGLFGLQKKVFFYDYFESLLVGSGGADRIVGMYWNETIDGAAGNDQLYGNSGNDTVIGGTDHDLMFGGAGTDNMQGVGGNDKIFGGTGGDTISGGDGNDTLFGEEGGDIISGDAGEDAISGGEDNDTLSGGAGRDIIYGDEGNDTIHGDAGDDFLNGGDGNDTLYGDDGNDLLVGGAGNDSLSGGIGNDIFVSGGGSDIINGGDGSDIIQLSGCISDYNISMNPLGVVTVGDKRFGVPDGTLTVTNVESIQFSDTTLDLMNLFPKINDLSLPQGAVFNGLLAMPAGYTLSLVQAPSYGSLILNANGTYTYTSPLGYAGVTGFRYQVTTPQGIVCTADATIRVSNFAAGGGSFTLGTEQVVRNITLTNDYWDTFNMWERPQPVKLNGGGYVLMWCQTESGTGRNVYYQVYNAVGTAVTSAAMASLTGANAQMRVSGVNLQDGGFAMAWEDAGSPGTIKWRRFDANGVAQTGEISTMPVPTNGAAWDTGGGDIVQLQDGSIAILWAARMGNGNSDVYMSRYDLSGMSLGSPVQINTISSGEQTLAYAKTLTNGNIVVVWREESGSDGSGESISMRIMSPTGLPVTAEQRVNTTTNSGQTFPAVAALVGGGCVVVWSSNGQDTSGWGIYAQRFDGAGNKVGNEFRINVTISGDQIYPTLTSLADGGVFVAWQSYGQDGSGWGVYGRRFDSNFVPISAEILINTTMTNNQELPSIVELNNGDLLATWRTNQTGSYQVMQKRLVANSTFINLIGTENAESLVAGSSSDTLTGAGGDDILLGAGGNDTIDGGIGRDISQYTGNLANYNISIDGLAITISDLRSGSPDGVDTLSNVEVLRFADQDVIWQTLFPSTKDLIIPQSKTYAGKVEVLSGDTVSLVQGPSQGTLSLTANGSFSYTSPATFAGQTTVKYKVTKVNGISRIMTLNISVDPTATDSYTFSSEQAVRSIAITNDYWDIFNMWERAMPIRLNGGGYVVMWTQTEAGTGRNVYYQVYNASGSGITSAIMASLTGANAQMRVTGTDLKDGGFAMAWEDAGSPGTVKWRRFDAQGIAQTSEISIMPTPTGGNYWDTGGGDIVQLQDGNLAVLWAARMGTGDSDIYMSLYNTVGTSLGSPIKVNTYTLGHQTLAYAKTLTNGNIAVVWREENGSDGSGESISVRVMSALGVPVTDEQRVNTTTNSGQTFPAIAALVGGGFVVSWSSNGGQDGSAWGVYTQRFDSTGGKVGGEVRANETTAGDQLYSTVTALANGGFFVTWQSFAQDGAGWGVYGRRFDSNGAVVGGDILLNATTAGHQEFPNITELTNGDLIATWRSDQSGGYQVMKRSLVASSKYIYAVGSDNLELMIGNATNDTLLGGGGDDMFIGDSGNDVINGGIGNDISRYSGNLANYNITLSNGNVTVFDTRSGSPDGTDTLTNVEILSFADQDVNLNNLFPETKSLILPYGTAYAGKLGLPSGYSAQVVVAPVQGTFVLSSNGEYTLTPVSTFAGSLDVQYKIVSPQGISQIVTMSVNVLPKSVSASAYTLGSEQVVQNINITNDYWDTFNMWERPQPVKLNGGGYVLMWCQTESGTGRNVYYQVYNAAGSAITSATMASLTGTNAQMRVSGINLKDGGFAMAWEDAGSPGTIKWRRFDANGVAQTGEISTMPTPTSGGAWDTGGGDIVQLQDGNIAVLWAARMGNGNSDIYMSRYNLAGLNLGSPIQVNTIVAGEQTLAYGKVLTNGNIVVIWREESGSDGSGESISMRVMSPTGLPVTAEQRVNTTTNSGQTFPAVAALVGGGCVVVWSSNGQDASGWGIYAQRFDSSGNKAGGEVRINVTTSGDQIYPTLTSLADGGFFVTWQSNGQDGSGWGVYGKRFDMNGNSVNGEILINTTTSGQQELPGIAELNNGDLLATWRTNQSGGYQIMQKRIIAPSTLGGYTVNDGESSRIIVGSIQADTINAGDGNDVLQGAGGNDFLSGGSGNDAYRFNVGDGADIIDNQDSLGTDIISFGSNIDRKDVWFQQKGYDLRVQVLGSGDMMTLQNWYTTDAQKVDQFELSNGYKLDKSAVDQLVSAMAGFNPQALGSVSALANLPQSVQNTITATWHT